MVSFDEFQKLELRVAKIVSAEDVPGKDKLFKLEVDAGEEGNRTLVAGLKPDYSAKDLVGKSIIIVANLEPATIAGIESNGMLLAAETEGMVALLSTDKELPAGAKVL